MSMLAVGIAGEDSQGLELPGRILVEVITMAGTGRSNKRLIDMSRSVNISSEDRVLLTRDC